MKGICILLTALCAGCLSSAVALAQTPQFTIINAGELKLGTNEITEDGRVTEYFGMNVQGFGPAFIEVTVGDQSFRKDYEFKTDPTRFSAFIFSDDLAESIKIDFRRGVFGNVVVSILNSEGVLQSSTTVLLDVTEPKKNCAAHPSPKLKKCAKVLLDKATKAQRKVLAKKFLASIRGPIVLEP